MLQLRFAANPHHASLRAKFIEKAREAQLRLEVRAIAHAAHDGDGFAQLPDKTGEQALVRSDLVEPKARLQVRAARGRRLAGPGLLPVDADGDNDFVENGFRLSQDGKVSEVKRIKAAGI